MWARLLLLASAILLAVRRGGSTVWGLLTYIHGVCPGQAWKRGYLYWWLAVLRFCCV
jgi:hypothetical protein